MTFPNYKRYQRRSTGNHWFDYVLLAVLACVLPLGIDASLWVPESARLLYVAFWSTLVGVLLARSRLSAWLVWLVGMLAGIAYSFQFAGKLLPSASLFMDDLGRALAWLWGLVVGGSQVPQLPFARTLVYIASRLLEASADLGVWVRALQQKTVALENTGLWLVASLGIWILTFNAAYQFIRRRRAAAALVPLGVALATNAGYTRMGLGYVQLYVAVTLFTLVWANIERLEMLWERKGIDFSLELRRDVVVVGSLLSIAVLGFAWALPYVKSDDAAYFFWDRFGAGIESFYDRLDGAFAGRNPIPDPTPGPRERALPSHDVRRGLPPGDDTILLVQTSDPVPMFDPSMGQIDYQAWVEEVLKRYWRQRTYDIYTGYGWDSGPRSTIPVQSDLAWTSVVYPHETVTQTFWVMELYGSLDFAVNEPIVVDSDYHVLVREPRDLAAFAVDADVYTVASVVPSATEQELGAAEGEYPDWISERYLALPDIPGRVRELSRSIVEQAGALTRYEKARAIEGYLRRLDYDLDLEAPPAGTDVVDYFLFEAKRGYCDYSATAMAVMLRSIGVAARYASGFAMGSFDEYRYAWVVRESNAHAWTEVYFPGYGWIEFEPTPTQRVFTRAATAPGWEGEMTLPIDHPVRRGIRLSPFWLGAAGLLFVVLFVIIWPPRWFALGPRTPRNAIARVYERLVHRARWLGLAPQVGQTPREYLAMLGQEVERQADFAEGAAQDIEFISRGYEHAKYRQGPISDRESSRVREAWHRLRFKLLRLVFVRMAR